MNESIESTSVLLKKFCLLYFVWEVDKDETLLSGWRQSKKFNRDFLSNQSILVTCTNHIANFLKEGVLEVGVVSRFSSSAIQKLRYRDNRNSQVNGKSLC